MTDVAKSTTSGARSYLKSVHEISEPEQIELAIRKCFQESQLSVTSHGKQIAILKALQLKCREQKLQPQFNELFCKLVNKVLPIKRNEPVGDRIVKFISSFVSSINPESEDDNANVDKQDERMYNKFIDRLARHLLNGLEANNKNVRYRACHILSHLMNNMTSIDTDLYEALSEGLLARIYDKEPHIRIKAITTLASFQEPDGSQELSNAAMKIRYVMQNDTNPEVRRACLRQIEKTKHTEPYIFERARDTNSVNRRLLYSKVLPDFKDFRRIDYKAREQLLKWGLKDREESVKKAAIKWLTENWMQTLNNDVMELLERLKVTKSDIAETAVRVFLDNRQDIVAKITFDEQIMRTLTPETSLLLRVYYQHCNDTNKITQIEKYFPEAAQFADILNGYFAKRKEILMVLSQQKPLLEAESSIDMTELDELDFVLRQLLIVASEYDYSDEFGRSRMLNTLRAVLTSDHLSDNLIEVLMLCIHKLSISERDFTQMIVEIINDLKDSAYEKQNTLEEGIAGESSRVEDDLDANDDEDDDDDENSFHSARDLSRSSIASANRSMQQELKQVAELSPENLIECLSIARRMLELVNKPLKDNITLMSILDSLIRPSIRRSETEIRKLGLICLGLCCILDKELAADSIFICAIFVTKSNEESLVVTGIKVISDLLAVHGISVLEVETANSVDAIAIARLFYRTLRDTNHKEAQATSGEALYKLFLCGVITDDELFETTLLSYFNPAINDNEQLKQCFSFCIPVYAFSHESHQERIARVTCDTLFRLFSGWDEMTEADGASSITPQSIVQQLMYWTDPYRVVNKAPGEAASSSVQVEVGLQLLSLLEKLEYSGVTKPFFKAVMTSLPRLTFTEQCDVAKLEQLYTSMEQLEGVLEKPLKDQPSRNAYSRFKEYVLECLEKAGGQTEKHDELKGEQGEKNEVKDKGDEELEEPAFELPAVSEKELSDEPAFEPVTNSASDQEHPEPHQVSASLETQKGAEKKSSKKPRSRNSAKKTKKIKAASLPDEETEPKKIASDSKIKKPEHKKRAKSEDGGLIGKKVKGESSRKKQSKKKKRSHSFSDSEDEKPAATFPLKEENEDEVGDTSAIVLVSDDD